MLAPQTIMSAKTTTGWGTSIGMSGYRHAVLTFSTSGLGVGQTIRIKIAHSFKEVAPTFSSATSATNPWSYVQVFDLAGGAPVNGSDGVAISGSDGLVNLEVNQNSASWLNVQVSTIDAGSVTVVATLSEE